jgi:hypothetical protein
LRQEAFLVSSGEWYEDDASLCSRHFTIGRRTAFG